MTTIGDYWVTGDNDRGVIFADMAAVEFRLYLGPGRCDNPVQVCAASACVVTVWTPQLRTIE